MITQLKNIILLGAPGSGKGTLAQKLEEKYHYCHLSTGDMFRQISQEDTPLGIKIKSIMNSGQLVSDEYTNQMIETFLNECIRNNQPFILDGYPRTNNQAEFLEKHFSLSWLIIYLDINQDLAIKRIEGRRSCPNCHRVYNIYFNPPQTNDVCDYCHHALIQRSDDGHNNAIKRFDVYQKTTYQLINYYQKKHQLVTIHVDNSNKDLLAEIEPLLNH